MKAMILHDEHGKIISISKVGNLKEAGSKFLRVGMVPGPGQRVLEVELDAAQERLPIRDLHGGFHVDVAASRLVKTL
ncbi:hypothetical protein B0G69_7545 [Paraburkholderia sp. RAU2J]|uniref:hypothetical protein n=1 Tax=Paraburkholderia sp. RAU2J TaxID=1938810 RepID=UPI000EAC5BB7|nr:hypothetical protein [Paraburkholderia sp. RAU2J]RKT14296.1 hypothetical protein B0G69_7545 [Paraburkholderia sp. RAU2J]